MFVSSDAMLRDPDFREMMHQCIRNFKLSNMDVEREFARSRASSPGDRPSLERVCCSSLLHQWLRDHLQGGGQHPCSVQRADLLKQGFPLAAQKRTSKGKTRAGLLYLNEKMEQVSLVFNVNVNTVTCDLT